MSVGADANVRFTPNSDAECVHSNVRRVDSVEGADLLNDLGVLIRRCRPYRANSPRADAEHAPISMGERDGSGPAFAPRIQRRSTGSDYRNRDCPPKYCLCGSSLRTSYTGSPNTNHLCLSRSPRTTAHCKRELAVNQQSRQQKQRRQLETRESSSVSMFDAITTPNGR